MGDASQQCPPSWREYKLNGIRVCGRYGYGCYGTSYPIGRQYNRVCGRVTGYQVASPDAFHHWSSIDGLYVDGVSVTHGYPREHIWTFAAGVTEGVHVYPQHVCPCVVPDPSLRGPPPDFVGNNHYCESGNSDPSGEFTYGHLYSSDPLWDGEQCEGWCCSDYGGKTPPWFSVELASPTSDDIEVGICGDQSLYDEDNPVALVELYVQ